MNQYGVDIIRAYAVSWRNMHSKPEVGVLEIFEEPLRDNTDSWQLKNYLRSFSTRQFEDLKAARSEIYNFLKTHSSFGDNYIKLTKAQDFTNIDFSKPIKSLDFPHTTIQKFRFICAKTGHPQLGVVSIYTQNAEPALQKQLLAAVIELKDQQFTTRGFTIELFLKRFNQMIVDDFVMSISYNRHGSISLQAVRCRTSVDFLEFMQRGVLE